MKHVISGKRREGAAQTGSSGLEMFQHSFTGKAAEHTHRAAVLTAMTPLPALDSSSLRDTRLLPALLMHNH